MKVYILSARDIAKRSKFTIQLQIQARSTEAACNNEAEFQKKDDTGATRHET